MRTLIIGDIHGGLKALIQLLDRANLKATDKLLFLGDYVDGWSDSAQLMNYLLELDNQYNCIFIKGNHDIWCEEWLKTGYADPIWLFHGGQATVNSYQNISEKTKLAHLNFFEKMPFYLVSDDNNLFIHAGFTSMHGPKKEFHLSNYNWDRTLWEMALAMDKNIKIDDNYYPQRLKLFNEIFIGHTPTTYSNSDLPMHAINVWNIDTGAAFKGKLSCIELETKKVYQSDIVQSLYPNEIGRNKD